MLLELLDKVEMSRRGIGDPFDAWREYPLEKHLEDYRAKHQLIGSNLNASTELAMGRYKDARQKQEDVAQKLADARAQLHKRESTVGRLPATLTGEKTRELTPLAIQLQD